MTDFKVTVSSARGALADMVCINAECGSEGIDVRYIPGDSDTYSKEHCTCRECRTEWVAELYPGRIESIHPRGGDALMAFGINGGVDTGVYDQIAYPKGPIVETLKSFLNAMKMGSVARRGEALAKLATMLRIEL